VQVLPSGDQMLRSSFRAGYGLRVSGMQASRDEHLRLTYRVQGLVNDRVLTVPTPGSIVGRWARVEILVHAAAVGGFVSTATNSRTQVISNKKVTGGWRYELDDVPGGSPAATRTTLG